MPNLLDIAYLPLAALALPRLLSKRRTGWSERMGRGQALPPTDTPRLLICAVSLGEVNLLRPLIVQSQQQWGSAVEIIIATTTDTGTARANELFSGQHRVVRYPLDFSWAVRRFLRRTKPTAVALAELELWPNFLNIAAAQGIPVAVLNGRLSDRSFPRYRRFGFITRRWFGKLAFVAAQDDRSAERFRALGAPNVTTDGNIKWDAATTPSDDAKNELVTRLGISPDLPLIVAGSTAPDEHQLLADALPESTQLLIAPCRPEWFEDAAKVIPDAVRWSDPKPHAGACVFLLDTLGKLSAAYALADIVILGRSFGDLHGSDPMEPAALGVPTLIGPAHADFRQSVADLVAAGALSVVTRESLAPALARLIENEPERRAMSRAATSVASVNIGAAARHITKLRSLLALHD